MHSKIPMNIIIIPKNGVRITEGLLYYYLLLLLLQQLLIIILLLLLYHYCYCNCYYCCYYLTLPHALALERVLLHPSLSGCLKELSVLTSQMQLKKWLSQKTLFIKAAALTRSLGKPSVTPTQAKKLVTEGFDYQSLSLLHRTSLTKDDFHESLKKRGVRSKPLVFKALSSH